ncbi:hypothetical protein KFK09_026385 [Dendrobium nobile]|uniref:Uncharacterized protein n=1 Tax=Dendrobium nobile TaxID=94219 RepID=A0A8T3A7D6_DENNO|nr:hypothetical protein KFK09_026385 [Dendrobium nobile]
MYDQLRSEYESVKRSAIQPPNNFFPRAEPDIFANMIDNRDPPRQDRSVFTPETPGKREEIWPPARHRSSSSAAFDLSGGSQVSMAPGPIDHARASSSARPTFRVGINNPAATLRNLIISPMKRPQLCRNRSNLFTL